MSGNQRHMQHPRQMKGSSSALALPETSVVSGSIESAWPGLASPRVV